MIKRLLFALFLVAAPLLASADGTNRAFLLTNEGTLFTLESVFTDGLNLQTTSTQVLSLTIRDDDKTTTTYVPETLFGGSHTNPALAYDPASHSLFIFWQRAVNNGMSSDLEFCSYTDGKWSDATSIGAANYHDSHNIQIAVTRKLDEVDEKGNHSLSSGLTVHAVWWEDTGRSEWARYAMFSIENGILNNIQTYDLSQFSDHSKDIATRLDSVEILRHPTIAETGTHDSVDIVFGDIPTTSMHHVTIKPTLYRRAGTEGGRLRVPIGVKDTSIGVPNFRTDANARVAGLTGDDKVVLYTTTKGGVRYVMYSQSQGTWSPARSLADDKISADAAVDALRQLANAD